MDLTFNNHDLARLCNERAELLTFAQDAAALEQLLNELACADTLGQVEELPHVLLLRAPAKRVAASGPNDAGVLLEPEKSKSYRAAEAAVIVAVAVGEDEFNPEGAEWPQASAMSRTMR